MCINCAQGTNKMPFFRFCAACNDVVDTDDYIEAQGFIWHRFCFCCSICKKLLDTTSYTHEYVNRVRPSATHQARKTTLSIGTRASQQISLQTNARQSVQAGPATPTPSQSPLQQLRQTASHSTLTVSPQEDTKEGKERFCQHQINLFCVECGAKRAKVLWQANTPKTKQQTPQPPPPTMITQTVSDKQSKAERRKSTFLAPNKVVTPTAPPVVKVQPTPKPVQQPEPEPVKCDACSKPIQGQAVKAGTKVFHPECFVCSGGCKRPITDKQYYNGPNDSFLCPECYQRIRLAALPVCAACGKVIDEESATVAGDLHYHNSCFVCFHCKKELHGIYVRHGNNVYCPEDHDRLFAQICTACHNPIVGQFLKVGTDCYHQECLKCSECSELLTTMSFGRDHRTGAFLCEKCMNRHLYC